VRSFHGKSKFWPVTKSIRLLLFNRSVLSWLSYAASRVIGADQRPTSLIGFVSDPGEFLRSHETTDGAAALARKAIFIART
jgi:hypothetical protein